MSQFKLHELKLSVEEWTAIEDAISYSLDMREDWLYAGAGETAQDHIATLIHELAQKGVKSAV